jgi:hypothetical protein
VEKVGSKRAMKIPGKKTMVGWSPGMEFVHWIVH